MASNNKLQDQQASVLDEAYKLGFMDGYGTGYDDGAEDATANSEALINDLENQNELLNELVDSKDQVIDVMASNAGKTLQMAKSR